jgi:hypothetical protein
MRLLGVTTPFTLDRHFKEQGFICLPAYGNSEDIIRIDSENGID